MEDPEINPELSLNSQRKQIIAKLLSAEGGVSRESSLLLAATLRELADSLEASFHKDTPSLRKEEEVHVRSFQPVNR
jgi:hypothetical protein